jgi:hypothetical protein
MIDPTTFDFEKLVPLIESHNKIEAAVNSKSKSYNKLLIVLGLTMLIAGTYVIAKRNENER